MLLVISKYDAEETASWLETNDWSFPILTDGASTIAAYGIVNDQPSREAHRGIPHPTTVIIDKTGAVRFVNVWINYRERTAPSTIVEELKKIQ